MLLPNTIEIAGKQTTFQKKFDVLTGMWIFNAEVSYEIADEQIVCPIEIKHVEEYLPDSALFKAKYGAEEAIKRMMSALVRKVHKQWDKMKAEDADADRLAEEMLNGQL